MQEVSEVGGGEVVKEEERDEERQGDDCQRDDGEMERARGERMRVMRDLRRMFKTIFSHGANLLNPTIGKKLNMDY